MFKQWKDNKGKTKVKFSGRVHEDVSNKTFFFYKQNEKGKNEVHTMDNKDYEDHKYLFEKNKPIWGGKFIIEDYDAVEFLKSNNIPAMEHYNGEDFIKLMKRKYIPTVFPPAFFDENGDKFEGVIPKGSSVEVQMEIEEYTKNRTLYRKAVLLGVKVKLANEATQEQEVYYKEEDNRDSAKLLKEITMLKAELKAARNDGAKVLEGVNAIVNGLVEYQKELLNELSVVKEELKEVKSSLQNNNNNILCTSSDNGTEMGKSLSEQFEQSLIGEVEQDNYDDEIPF